MDRANYSSGARLMPYDPELELQRASCQSKQLIILAADVVLAELSIHDGDPAAQAEQLVDQRILPACYLARYNAQFLQSFAGTLQLARNLLVSDAPYIPTTAGELAARAIFTTAREILTSQGARWRGQAAELDPRLPGQLDRNAAQLADELEALRDATLEDTDVVLLFGVPPDGDPDARLSPRLRGDERALLLFDNWLVPFGNAPRPHVTYDGRAWPAPF